MKRFSIGLAVALCMGCGEDSKDAESGPKWQPSRVVPAPLGPRGLLDKRGLIHAHSVYSHDACDGEPRASDGSVNAPCFADFRQAVCTVSHDFVLLTDHDDSFAEAEFPAVLLHDAAAGDTLVERDGKPVANWLSCGDRRALILAGTESGAMPVGLEAHVSGDIQQRHQTYDEISAQALDSFHALGAVNLVAHTEDWTVDQLVDLPLDGFEMFNLHANFLLGAGGLIGILANLDSPDFLPHSDLVLLPVVSEDARYLDTWSQVLARGAKRVTTMGTDCHQNTLQQELPDGERGDSYRRMMIWFSNHLLIQPDDAGNFDDRALKEALRGGRLYGAFEVLGYPEGFDYHAQDGQQVFEMGSSTPVGSELIVNEPRVIGLGSSQRPELTLRLLRATDSGWELVSEGSGKLSHVTSAPGAYRAEVRMRPRHLRPYLGSYADLADQDFVWIYSNAIYVE